MTGLDPDPRYAAARRVLLDALTALAPHGKAIVVVGAQAVYLRTRGGEVAATIAPFTTDSDLALDPALLGDEPQLAVAMTGAGFRSDEPGIWYTTERVAGQDIVVPVDLIVPEAASTGEGRRGARLGPHGNRAARRAVGLEAALVDHSPITISALDRADARVVTAEVAGPAALIVAKAHKINDRFAAGRRDRLSDKDASDVYRIMQTLPPADAVAALRRLLGDPLSAAVTEQALEYMQRLFGRRAGEGVAMAQRALRLVVDEVQVATLCVAFTEQILRPVRDPARGTRAASDVEPAD